MVRRATVRGRSFADDVSEMSLCPGMHQWNLQESGPGQMRCEKYKRTGRNFPIQLTGFCTKLKREVVMCQWHSEVCKKTCSPGVPVVIWSIQENSRRKGWDDWTVNAHLELRVPRDIKTWSSDCPAFHCWIQVLHEVLVLLSGTSGTKQISTLSSRLTFIKKCHSD